MTEEEWFDGLIVEALVESNIKRDRWSTIGWTSFFWVCVVVFTLGFLPEAITLSGIFVVLKTINHFNISI